MRLVILALGLVTASSSQALDSQFWDNIAKNLNRLANPTKASDPYCPQYTSDGPKEIFSNKDMSLVRLCIKETCGDVKPPLTSDHEFDAYGKIFALKYEKLIEAAAQNFSKNEKLGIELQIEELERQRPYSELSTEEKILSHINFSSNYDLQDKLGFSVGESKIMSALLEDTDGFARKHQAAFLANLAVANSLPINQVRERMKNLNQDFKTKFQKQRIWNELHDIVLQNENELKIEEAANSDYYRNNLVELYASAKTTLDALEQKEKWRKSLVNLGNPGKQFPTLLKSFRAHTENVDAKVRSSLASCAAHVGGRLSRLPSNVRLSEIKQKIELTKKEIESKIFVGLSAHSARLMKVALDKAQINLPPSKEGYEAAFKAKFNAFATMDYGELKDTVRVSDSYEFHNAQSFAVFMSEQCDYGILKKDADHAVVGFERINLSELVDDSVWTEGLIAHEFLHLLDPSLSLLKLSGPSTEAIIKMRSCLTGLQNGNKFYLTEDWADAGAALVTSGLKENEWCTTVYGANLLSTRNDKHSPDLFRMLHKQIYKKEGLAPSCKKLLESQTPKIQLKKCF